ncbi:Metal homeostatis protein BSD2 [Smittium mucronatum]|uniref:Metal homeostatis protein BSD2 n=1 Tax=Smittium mucronatum TaxID=133383 RepID=A0A1R0GZ75_9FUNG|nr:Metal homeostatis protein BSD2 [Smittium mucronatum]
MNDKNNYQKINSNDPNEIPINESDDDSQLTLELVELQIPNKLEIQKVDESKTEISQHKTKKNSIVGHGSITGMRNDGVFSNLSVKPEISFESDDPPPLPAYNDIYGEQLGQSTFDCIDDANNPPKVDGMPVGTPLNFFLNFIVALVFHVIGFLLTYFMHSTHAALSGSIAGFGTAMINFGVYIILFKVNGSDSHSETPKPTTDSKVPLFEVYPYDNSSDSLIFNNFLAVVLIVTGVLFVLKAVHVYYSAYRTEQLIKADPNHLGNNATSTSIF